MNGAGAVDRRKPGALRAGGDRPARVRAVRAELFDLNQDRIAIVTVVTDDRPPEVVMFEGEPFLRVRRIDVLAYDQVRPYRAYSMIEDLRP